MQKTIAITANSTWYLYNFRKNTILRLIYLGYRVVVISPFEEKFSYKIKQLGADYETIKISRSGRNVFKESLVIFGFFSIFKKQKPFVVLNFTPKNNVYASFAATLLNIKIVNNIAGLGLLYGKNDVSTKIVTFLYRLSQPLAHTVFFQNKDDLDLFTGKNIVRHDRAQLLAGSGVDLKRFIVKEIPFSKTTKFIVVARLLKQKGIVEYVEAAKLLKQKFGTEVEFNILGIVDMANPNAITGEELNKWHEKGYINYLGASDSVEDVVADMDCVVLPSYYREGVPKSLLEAGAMGKPIVTTNNIGCRDAIINNVTGFLCQPKCITSLTQKMEEMHLIGHKNRVNMGKEGRRFVTENFNEDTNINQYVQVIRLCETKKS